jgi:DNA-binding Lrp family transcriptional regulator
MITAFVMLNAEPGRVKPLAEELLGIKGVTEVYSVTGPYDLIAIVRVREHDELSELVTEAIATCGGIVSTETVVAFRAFTNRDLDAVWDIGVN